MVFQTTSDKITHVLSYSKNLLIFKIIGLSPIYCLRIPLNIFLYYMLNLRSFLYSLATTKRISIDFYSYN